MSIADAFCILGVGNVLRKDDGIAALVCSRIADLSLPGVDVRTCHQLGTGMIDELSEFKELILVDAALQEEPVVFVTLSDGTPPSTSFTHELDARLFAALMKRFAGDRTRVHLCTVAGTDFGFGLEPSALAIGHADLAVETILERIRHLGEDD